MAEREKMQQDNTTQHTGEERRSGRTWLVVLIILLILLGSGNAFVFYLLRQEQKKTIQLAQKVDTLEHYNAQLDSLMKVIKDSIAYYSELAKNNDRVAAERLVQLQQKEEEIRKLQQEIKKWKAQYYNVRKTLQEAGLLEGSAPPTQTPPRRPPEKPSPSMLEELRRLQSENTYLKETADLLEKRVKELMASLSGYQQKVKDYEIQLGKKLVMEDIVVSAVKLSETNEKSVTRARKAENIKICFKPEKNPFTPEGELEILVRIIDPEGVTIYLEEMGSGKFEDQYGNEKLYTFKTIITYPPPESKVCRYWEPFLKLTKGTYKVEIYHAGYLMGVSSFTLR